MFCGLSVVMYDLGSGCLSESRVDSVCRDGADVQYIQYLSKSRITLPQICFMIWKTHIVDQKPRGRQLNAKVCHSESAIFRILSSLRLLFKQR